MALDTETTGLDTHSPNTQTTHISYWTNAGRGRSFEVSNHEERARAVVTASNSTVTKLFFNALFDIPMLAKVGVLAKSPVICVLLMAQMMFPDERNRKLKHLVRKFLKDPFLEEIRLKEWLKANKGKSYGEAPKHIIEPYNLKDSRTTLELFMYMCGGMDKHNQWTVLEREMLLMRRVVMPMENYGVMLDLKEVDRVKIATRASMKEIKSKLVELTGNPAFNPNSQPQVMKALAKEGIFRPTTFSRKTGRPKADTVALIEYPSPLGSLVVRYRKVSKAATTYLNKFTRPILRVHFNQGGARTGRFSSSGPNLQNIPRPDEDSELGRIRKCFIARPGRRLLCIDYKQLQLRLAAHFSSEPHMLEAINSGADLHNETCFLVFDKKESDPDWDMMRYLAKTLNFSMLFGAGPAKFRETVLKDTDGKVRITLAQASRYIDDWKSKHPKILKMFDDVAIEVVKTGGVTTPYGRFLPVDPHKTYIGVNYKIQGTEADFVKLRMLQVMDLLKGKETRLMMVNHDELIFDWSPREKKLVYELVAVMEDPTTFKVPLTCSASYGINWQDKKKISL